MIIGETVERHGTAQIKTWYEREGDIIREYNEYTDKDVSTLKTTTVWWRQDLPTDTMREVAQQLIAQADILDGRGAKG